MAVKHYNPIASIFIARIFFSFSPPLWCFKSRLWVLEFGASSSATLLLRCCCVTYSMPAAAILLLLYLLYTSISAAYLYIYICGRLTHTLALFLARTHTPTSPLPRRTRLGVSREWHTKFWSAVTFVRQVSAVVESKAAVKQQ